MKDELCLCQVKMCRFINTINQLFTCSGNSKSVKTMKEHDISLFWLPLIVSHALSLLAYPVHVPRQV